MPVNRSTLHSKIRVTVYVVQYGKYPSHFFNKSPLHVKAYREHWLHTVRSRFKHDVVAVRTIACRYVDEDRCFVLPFRIRCYYRVRNKSSVRNKYKANAAIKSKKRVLANPLVSLIYRRLISGRPSRINTHHSRGQWSRWFGILSYPASLVSQNYVVKTRSRPQQRTQDLISFAYFKHLENSGG